MQSLSPVPLPDLGGKVALVTGAGRGIGRVATRLLLQAGAKVFAGTLDDERIEGATTIRLDVTDAASVARAFAVVEQEASGLDILINNAGVISPVGHVGEIDAEAFAVALNINVAGPLRMMQAALPFLKSSRGVIINAGSGAAFTPLEGWAAYCSSKAALAMLSRVVDLEYGAAGVKIFTLGIPPTNTDMQGIVRASGLNQVSRIPKDNLIDPRVPASVMVWLCGPTAREITDLLVDVRDERFRALMG